MPTRLALLCLAVLALVNSISSPAQATKYWKNSVGTGTWGTDSNWSAVSAAGADNGGAPIGGEAVNIVSTDGTPRTVTYNVSAPSLALLSVDLTGPGSDASELSMPNNNSLTANGLFIGGYNGISLAQSAGRGAFIQSAGTTTVNSGDFALGYGANSIGTYTLSGTGALVANKSEYIGISGNGTFNHSAGTNIIATATGFFEIGETAGSNGTYNLSGTGALTSNTDETIGDIGTGVFNQSGGSNTTNGGKLLYLGKNVGSSGAYNLSDSGVLAVAGDQFIGYSGHGSLSITSGGKATNGNGDLAVNSGSIGTATVDGPGSRWINNSVLAVGASGAGTLNITNGGYVSSFHGRIGRDAGSIGTVTVDGPSSTWQTTQDLTVGGSGTATLTIQNDALVQVGNNLSINGTSIVNLNGGTLRFNGYSQQPAGVFNFTGGTVQLEGNRTIGSDTTISTLFGASPVIPTGKGLTVEGPTHIQSNVAVSGGKLEALSSLDVGNNIAGGTTALTVTNSGTVHSESDVSLGSAMTSQSPGSITVDGPGSALDSLGNISIGRASAGVLQVSGGGVVTMGGNATIGSAGVNGQGTATVTDPGSSWTIAGNLSLNGINNGLGTLTVQDQALVSVGGALSITGANAINLSGGTLRLNTVTGSSLSGLNYSAGIIELAGDRNIGSDPIVQTLFGASPTIPTGKGLKVDGTATLLTTTTLNGGTFSAGQLVNPQLLQVQSGTVDVTNQPATIAPGAVLDLGTNATINYTLGISNQGLITGDGHLGGTMQNAATGEIRADLGKTLTLTGANNTNDGLISLLGGTAVFTQDLTNNAGGSVTGNGTLMASAIVNQGAMSFSGTTSLISNSIDLHGQVSVATAATLNLVSQNPVLLAGVTNVNHGTIAASNGVFFGTPQLRDDANSVLASVSLDERLQAQSTQQNAVDYIKGQLDSKMELGDMASLRMQMYLDQRSKFLEALSNLLQKIDDTQGTIIGNIKSTLQTDTEVLGQFVPGGSAGISSVHITGQTTFDSGSTLALEFEGTGAGQFDTLQVDSGVHFQYGVRLALSLLDPSDPQNGTALFAPNIGDYFDVVSAPTIDAQYLQVEMPALTGRAFVAGVVDNPSGGQVLRIYVVPGAAPLSGVPGDYNNDGVVDAADYVVWRDFLGEPVLALLNDDTDGVGLDDYTRWKANFGQHVGSGAGTIGAVAEPSTAFLLILAVSGLSLRRGRAT